MFTAMASTSYTKNSLDALHHGMAEDLNALFTSGLEVNATRGTVSVHVAVVGGKGDWPYVRKSFGLSTGFSCSRICHMCLSDVA